MRLTGRTWGAVVLFALVSLAAISLRPLVPIDETRYVAVAWEMHQTGNYLVPTKNFEIYTHKPPLLFWSINLLWAVFGVSEAVARMVGPLYGMLAIVLTARLGRVLWPEQAGIGGRAAWVLAGSLAYLVFATATMFDAALSVAVLAGLLSLVHHARTGRWRSWLGLGAALALGGLAKGPVIFLHLVPAVLLMPYWARGIAPDDAAVRLRHVLLGLFGAVLFGLAIVLVWLLPAVARGGAEYRDAILWTQSAGRIVNSFAHARPVYWLVAALPLLLYPWIWMPQLWRGAWRAGAVEPGMRLVAVWALAALVLFSLVDGKQLHYLLPELPAVALLVARVMPEGGARRPWLAVAPLAAVALALVVAGLGVFDGLKPSPLLAPDLALVAVGLGLLVVCGVALNAGLLRGGAILSAGLVLGVLGIIRMTGLHDAFDARRIAAIVAPYEAGGIAVYVDGQYNAEFNFALRAERPVAVLRNAAEVTAWRDAHPEGALILRLDRLRLSDRPEAFVTFRDQPYGLYLPTDATRKEPQS